MNSTWEESGLPVSRSRRAFRQVMTGASCGVIAYHTWLGLSDSASQSQFASGTMPNEAMNGANQ